MLFDRINTPAGNVSKKFIFKIRTRLNKFTGETCLTAPANVQVYPVTKILGGCTQENQGFVFPVEFKILIIPRGAPRPTVPFFFLGYQVLRRKTLWTATSLGFWNVGNILRSYIMFNETYLTVIESCSILF